MESIEYIRENPEETGSEDPTDRNALIKIITRVAASISNCPLDHVEIAFVAPVDDNDHDCWECRVAPYRVPRGRGRTIVRSSLLGLGTTPELAAEDVLKQAAQRREAGVEGF